MSTTFRRPHRVLVVGDLMLDEYLRGAVRRVSPEAPVPVLESSQSDLAPGGAANVASNLAALGCEVRLCGLVGNDPQGDALCALLAERGIGAVGIVRDSERPTTHKLRVVAQGQHMLRIDKEVRTGMGAAAEAALTERIEAEIGEVDAVVLSDYYKGVLGAAVLPRALALANARGLPVAVDPKGSNYARYRGAHILTPNLHELEVASGKSVEDDACVVRAAKVVLAQTEAHALLVTCGKDGMVLVSADGNATHIAAEARDVYDVTGAGDTVIAVLVLALLRGYSYVQAARLANTAAGIVVGKLGTSSVSLAELEARVEGMSAKQDKICDRETLLARVQGLRAAGGRIVFTNGCFDLLHAGHVEYLAAARRLGDMLIVGVNSDASVARNKGPGRPLVDEHGRARVLAGLSSVDQVVIFDEDTPEELISSLRPDVLVKGADYHPEQVVGRALVESYGGRLELVPLSEGWSTSAIVERIVGRYGGKGGRA